MQERTNPTTAVFSTIQKALSDHSWAPGEPDALSTVIRGSAADAPSSKWYLPINEVWESLDGPTRNLLVRDLPLVAGSPELPQKSGDSEWHNTLALPPLEGQPAQAVAVQLSDIAGRGWNRELPETYESVRADYTNYARVLHYLPDALSNVGLGAEVRSAFERGAASVSVSVCADSETAQANVSAIASKWLMPKQDGSFFAPSIVHLSNVLFELRVAEIASQIDLVK
jgi:hypothetical protein